MLIFVDCSLFLARSIAMVCKNTSIDQKKFEPLPSLTSVMYKSLKNQFYDTVVCN